MLNCCDIGSGPVTCAVKEEVKVYFYSIGSIFVEIAQRKAFETALANAVTWEMSTREAQIYARQEGIVAAEFVKQQVQHVAGYYGGSILEAFLMGLGTLFVPMGGRIGLKAVIDEASDSDSDDSLVDEAPIFTTNDFLAMKLLLTPASKILKNHTTPELLDPTFW